MPPFQPTAVRAARRSLALLTAALLATTALTQLSPPRAAASTVTVEGLTYFHSPGAPSAGATLTSCGDAGPTITVPDTVTIEGTDHAVTAIGDHACGYRQLTSVTLPDTLTSIGYAAFYMNELGSVSLPDSLTTLGELAFGANQLTSVTLPDALTTIAARALLGNHLTSLDLPDQLTTIGDEAFGANRLTSLTLPAGVTAVGVHAFSGNQLTSATLGDSLTSIDSYAFLGNQLASVTLPRDLTTIGDFAFGNNRLTSVTLPGKVTSIGAGAFDWNYELREVRFAGPAPATITGADQRNPSLGTATGLAVAFHARHQRQIPQEGFTTPEWLGYTAQPAYTVTFDTGSRGPVIAPQTIWPGEALKMPTDPVRPTHAFTGWYTQLYPKRPFDPHAPVSSDLTLRAGWKKVRTSSTPLLGGSTSLAVGSLGDPEEQAEE